MLGSTGGAFKSGRPTKKRPFALQQLCMYARMRNRDTRPLYEQYLMDCIGRAQTLNLTFTIIAALRGGMRARGGASLAIGREEWSRGTQRNTTMHDVNFIIPAKKLRPDSGSPGAIVFLSLFFLRCLLSQCFVALYFYFSFRSFPCHSHSFFRTRGGARLNDVFNFASCMLVILHAFCTYFSILSLSLFDNNVCLYMLFSTV